MQTIGSSLADDVRTLSAKGAAHDRHLYRLIDLHAAAEAAVMLHAAATCPDRDLGPLANAIVAADALLAGEPDDAVTRERVLNAVTAPEFLSFVPHLVSELREIAFARPDTGACTVATAFELWSWTMNHFRAGEGARGPSANVAIDELSAVLAPLLAARSFVLEVASMTAAKTPAEVESRPDLCHVHAARAAAATGAACAELVFGYRRHLSWDAEGCASCYASDELDGMETMIPGIGNAARMTADVVEADGSHPVKAGPCASFTGMDAFIRLRNRLDGCLTGARIAKDRAAAAIGRSMAATTPEGNA
ncbi:MAG: hypothetical protein ACYC7A_19315 [Thermoanaerobaculia bacterium]